MELSIHILAILVNQTHLWFTYSIFLVLLHYVGYLEQKLFRQ
jgi:hypothetical protein